jgi:hypothetical protein
MEAVLIYLLKSSGLIALFFLAYHFLVRKETFFTSNRWFLLSGLVTSLLLPLFFIKKILLVESPKIPYQEFVANAPKPLETIQAIPVVEAFDWLQFFWVTYAIIACLLVLKIVYNFFSLYRILYKQQVIRKEQFKLVNINNNIAPFSFFNYIVYNSSLYTDEELQSILLHEKIHSQEMHSVDVIIAELFCAVFWFHPFIWLYKKAITQNLEYIADQKAIKQLDDKKSYQHALLKVVSNKNCLPITNNFYQSLIKKRIIMLNKNQSHKRNSWKYAVIIPALIGFIFLFQIKVEAQSKPFTTTNETAVEQSKVGTPIEGAYIFDKISSDNELETDALVINSKYNINFKFDNVKRNSKGEIIAIKMSFDDKKGNKGKVEQSRTIPIRPIFFKVSKSVDGKNIIGFYDNHEMIVKPFDEVNEKKIATVESIHDDALIYVDGDRYDKESLNYLDPKGLEKIEILKDAESLKKYAADGKNVVYVITTNWDTREENIAFREKSPSSITLTNGDEVVLFDRCNLKIAKYPSIKFTDNSPILIIDGVEHKNPRYSIEALGISKMKTIKVLNENDQEVTGTPIYKLIITTK